MTGYVSDTKTSQAACQVKAVGLCSCVVFRDNSTIIRERMYLKSKQNDRLGIYFIALFRQLYIISVASEIAECFEISIRFA